MLVATNTCWSRQCLSRQKYFLATNIILLRQAYFCRAKKTRVCRDSDKTFVATKIILVASPTSDTLWPAPGFEERTFGSSGLSAPTIWRDVSFCVRSSSPVQLSSIAAYRLISTCMHTNGAPSRQNYKHKPFKSMMQFLQCEGVYAYYSRHVRTLKDTWTYFRLIRWGQD